MQAETQPRWVPAAVARDIPNGTVIPASLPGGPIAIWRSASGKLSANGDRCPHRGMRLSHGFVRGETLSCIYHGWRYGRDGACTHIPAHPDVAPPKTINCGPLPVCEQNGVVWVSSIEPNDAPPDVDGFTALRSMVVCASVEAIIEVSKGKPIEGGAEVKLADTSARLLLSGTDTVFVIALVDGAASTAEQIAASTALERLRHLAETRDD